MEKCGNAKTISKGHG